MDDQIIIRKVIRKRQRSATKYDIQLSDGSQILVTEDVLVKYALLEGSTLSQKDIQAIHKANSYEDAYQQSLRWLGRSPQAEQTIRQKLKQKGYMSPIIEAAVQQCIKNGYINDGEYAIKLASIRMSRSKGRKWIEQELRHLGIEERYITAALKHCNIGEEQERALLLAQKKWRQLSAKPLQERQHKTAQTLARRGYSSELIWKIIPELNDELDNNEL